MRALTVRQPWASLIACGAKTIYTSPRSTSYRGDLLIHAGASSRSWREMDDPSLADQRAEVQAVMETLGVINADGSWPSPFVAQGLPGTPDGVYFQDVMCLPLGAVVAVARLADVVPVVHGHEEGAIRTVDVDDDSLWLVEPEEFPETLESDLLTEWLNVCPAGDPTDLPAYEVFCHQHGLSTVDQREITDQQPLGDFTPGRYAWLLTDVAALADPIPAKGRQGLWTPDADLVQDLVLAPHVLQGSAR